MKSARYEKDKKYEDSHKKERKEKSVVWGTSMPREEAEEINEFLKKNDLTKVQLIRAGYESLYDNVISNDLKTAKIADSYDDFFGFEYN